MTPGADSPVEAYLDHLLAELTVATNGDLRRVRHLVAEAEGHLWDATAAGVADGLPPAAAEAEAVARFGPSRSFAVAEVRHRRSLRDVLAGCVVSGWWLGAVGAIAVGASGLLAWIVTALGGQAFTAGPAPRSALDPADCARWMAGSHASTCAQAAIADWAHDTVLLRIGFGILGLLALGAWWVWRRARPAAEALPQVVVDAVAVTVFGAAALWLAGQTIDSLVVSSGRGAGQWLAAAPVALVVVGAFAARLLRQLRAAPA